MRASWCRGDEAVEEGSERAIFQSPHRACLAAMISWAREAVSVTLSNLFKVEHETLEQQQLLARRRLVTNLPTELLRAIFQVFIDSQEDDLNAVLGLSRYDAELARQPFALAAVCQRWRQLSLGTPEL